MITEKQKQKAIELSKQGNSQTQIAKQLKISRTKILEIIKESKIILGSEIMNVCLRTFSFICTYNLVGKK